LILGAFSTIALGAIPPHVPAPPEPSSLTGVVERIIFLNEENHYTIAEFRPDAAEGSARPEPVTIVGALPGVECGETLHLKGEWTRHATHGAQFKIAGFTSELPASVYGIRKYLGSGLVPGIGRVYANKIVDAFGTDTFRILSEESGKLRGVAGIGKKRATAIKAAWDGKRSERELYIFLQTYGVSPGQCVKLVRQYGAQAKAVLTAEPYRVAREIDGIGFKTADRIAINLGFANDAAPRLDAGILFALETLQEEGHTAYPEERLRDLASEMLDTSSSLVTARVEALVKARQLARHHPPGEENPLPGSGLLQLPPNDRAERKIAESVARLMKVQSGLPPIKVEAALHWAEEKAGFAFHELQSAAVRNALSNKLSVLTGGPGTGKTSALRSLVSILKAKGVRVHLAAPTGRAAQRLTETTGGYASTIHRLLKYDPASGFTANESHPLATDFLVVDEASMLDTRLAAALFQAVPSRAHLLLVGDTDQLPSVGAGNVLQDLITASRAPVTRLSVIFRQKGQSGIVTTAHAINGGDTQLPFVSSSVASIGAFNDLSFVTAKDAEDCVQKVIEICRDYVPLNFPWCNPVADVQVMAPMHKGAAGVANLNLQLQGALNGKGKGVRTLAGEFRRGDKVIQLRNNYDKNLFNGDIGTVVSADLDSGEIGAEFDGERHAFSRAEMGDLGLAYAISIHKSQGSEYPVVVVPLLKAHFMMLQRNLLYTAVTRGKRKVFLVGEVAAYAMAVRNSESKERITHLKQKLSAGA
jgi:exodeoxyribonuclease V alpha subunit